MADSYNKKENQRKKAQKKKEKQARKVAKKGEEKSGKLEDMLAYVDENGNIVESPPDQTRKKKEIKAEDIELGVPKKEELPEDFIFQGQVTFFNTDKGYGFIKDRNSQESYFVHLNNCMEPIAESDKVQFELEKGDRGMVATKVKKI